MYTDAMAFPYRLALDVPSLTVLWDINPRKKVLEIKQNHNHPFLMHTLTSVDSTRE